MNQKPSSAPPSIKLSLKAQKISDLLQSLSADDLLESGRLRAETLLAGIAGTFQVSPEVALDFLEEVELRTLQALKHSSEFRQKLSLP